MQAGTHQIAKLVMKMHLPSQDGAHQLMSKAAGITRTALLKSIEKVLDEFDTNGKIIRIPRIEIDLTEEEMDTISQEAAIKIAEKLRSELARLMQHHNVHDWLAQKSISVDAGGLQVTDRESDEEGQFFYFLENGCLPWWGGWQPELLKRVIQRISNAGYSEVRKRQFIQRLVQLLEKAHVRSRLAAQLPQTGLEQLFMQESKDQRFQELVHLAARSAQHPRKVYVWAIKACMRPVNLVAWTEELLGDSGAQVSAEVLLVQARNNQQLFRSVLEAAVRWAKRTGKETQLEALKEKYIWIESDPVIKKLLQEEKKKESAVIKKDPLPEMTEAIEVSCAGLVIVHAFLVPFFEALGLLEKKQFKDDAARHYAVHVLHYLCTGEEELPEEHQLVLHKLLCGLEPAEVLETGFSLTEEHKVACEDLLQSVIDQWTALKKTSPAALRTTFFIRKGSLTRENSGWSLKMERNTVDLLLDKLPWGLGVIKMPWYNEFIFVEW